MNSASFIDQNEEADPLGSVRHVTLLYNIVDAVSDGEEQNLLADDDTVKTVQGIYKTLTRENFIVDLFALNESNVSKLLEIKTDIIFNLCYGIGSLSKTEDQVAKILCSTGVPFTGAKAKAIRTTTDKALTKKIFLDHGIPTPHSQVFVSKDDVLDPDLRYPLFVKPKSEDCSFGIYNNAVVTNIIQLRKQLDYVLRTYNEPVLVEEYIQGRELNVTIVGNGSRMEMFPISEIVFGKAYDDGKKWKIVDFDAKWVEESSSFSDTTGVCPADLSKDITDQIEKYAKRAYQYTGCADYARVDIRLAADNTPYFLEVNINPGIGISDGAVRSAKTAGFTYSGFLKRIMREALIRHIGPSVFHSPYAFAQR